MSLPKRAPHVCSIGDCGREFDDEVQRLLHEAQEGHCARCGACFGARWSNSNWASLCALCLAETKETEQLYDF